MRARRSRAATFTAASINECRRPADISKISPLSSRSAIDNAGGTARVTTAPREPPSAPKQGQRFGDIEPSLLQNSQSTPLVYGGALQVDAMPDVGGARQQSFAPPLALDVNGHRAGRRGHIKLHNVFIWVARRALEMLLSQEFAHAKCVVEFAHTIGGEQFRNLIRRKSRVIAHANILVALCKWGLAFAPAQHQEPT